MYYVVVKLLSLKLKWGLKNNFHSALIKKTVILTGECNKFTGLKS